MAPPKKNAAAAALARHKWRNATKAQRRAASQAMHDALTPEQRSERARRAAVAMHRANGHRLKDDQPPTDCERTPAKKLE